MGVVKAQRLRWLGHIRRMHSNRTTKKVFESRVSGKKRRGRRKLRWKEEDIRELNLTQWEEKTGNKNE
ncbi:hypothetical protein ILUMI_15538 [Ignelater luminosus]|uniref:Uncharacterized protein n=1 Tax=Ignelater luminosus TaxID=2038154 RepID=A0A8K0CWB3_IGNLU|nr:hypothetical protein ILUMI_15538 [Ignelater luminosus]